MTKPVLTTRKEQHCDSKRLIHCTELNAKCSRRMCIGSFSIKREHFPPGYSPNRNTSSEIPPPRAPLLITRLN